jgi:hypothetical protein
VNIGLTYYSSESTSSNDDPQAELVSLRYHIALHKLGREETLLLTLPMLPKLAGVVVALEPHIADVGVIHALLHASPPERRAQSPSAYWNTRASAAAAAWRTVVMEGDLGPDNDGTGVKVVTDATQLEANHRRRDGAQHAFSAELIARLQSHRVRTARNPNAVPPLGHTVATDFG